MLAAAFPDNIKLFTARRGGELLGGVIVYETDARRPRPVHRRSPSAATPSTRSTPVVDFLITAEYVDKAWFDFGISTTEEGRNLNTGLIRNKESFGARAVVYDTYRVELSGHRALG